MLHKVVPGPGGLAITPQKKHGRPYFMGTVILTDARVRFEDGTLYLVGEIIHEAVEQDQPTHKVRGRMEKYKISMGEITAKAAYVVGGTVFVSKEVR